MRKIGFLSVVIILLIAALAVNYASAATPLYVSPAGSDTSNNCQSGATPCATIQYAIGQATAGDTIDG